MKIITSLLLIATLSTQIANAQEKQFAVIQKKSQVGTEQESYKVEGNKVVVLSNSNFMTKNYPYHYGKFEVALTPEIKKEIANISREEKTKKTEDVYVSPHEKTLYINGKKVSILSSKYIRVVGLLKKLFESKDLKTVDGIILKNKADREKIKCTQNEGGVCEFKYGYIHE